MKLWDDLLKNTEYAWNHWGLRTLSFSVVSTFAKAVYYLAEQFSAIPKTVIQIATPPACALTIMSDTDFLNKSLKKKLKINRPHYFITEKNCYCYSVEDIERLDIPLKEKQYEELTHYFLDHKHIEKLSLEQIQKITHITGHYFQAPLRRVVTHVGLNVAENMLPMMLVLEGNRIIQNAGDQLINSTNNSMPYVSFGLKSGLMLLSVGVVCYKYSRNLALETRKSIVMLEAAKNYPSMQDPLLKAICEKQKCTKKRVLGGIARQALVREGVNSTLNHVGNISYLRIPAEVLKIQQDGRYIVDQIMPMCDRHVTNYIEIYPEVVWATGLMNRGITLGAWFTTGLLLNIPISYVYGFFGADKEIGSVLAFALADHLTEISKPFIRMFTAFLVSNMTYPNYPEESKENLKSPNQLQSFNPLMLYTRVLAFGVDTMAKILLETIPALFPIKKEPVKWENVIANVKGVLEHPLLHKKYPWVLMPEMFQSKEQFVRDLVVKHNWDLLQRTVLDYLYALEAIRSSKTIKGNIVKGTIKAASFVPIIPSSAAWLLVGLSPTVTKLVIELLANRQVTIFLGDARRLLEHLHTNNVVVELPDNFQPSMQNQRSLIQGASENIFAQIEEEEEEILKNESQLVDPHMLIRNMPYHNRSTFIQSFQPQQIEMIEYERDIVPVNQEPILIDEQTLVPLTALYVPQDPKNSIDTVVVNHPQNDKQDDLELSCVELHIKEDKGNQIKLSSNSASAFNSVLKKEIVKEVPLVSKNDPQFTDEYMARMMIKSTHVQLNKK